MRRAALWIVLTSLVALGSASNAAAEVAVETAYPGSQEAGYALPLLVAQPGGSITFANLDNLAGGGGHDLVAFRVYGSSDRFWCQSLPAGAGCPLFWTPVIPFAGTTPVYGLEQLEAGKAYPFYCTLHPKMRGTLIVP